MGLAVILGGVFVISVIKTDTTPDCIELGNCIQVDPYQNVSMVSHGEIFYFRTAYHSSLSHVPQNTGVIHDES